MLILAAVFGFPLAAIILYRLMPITLNTDTVVKDWKSSAQPILTVFLVVAPLLTAPGSPIHSAAFAWAVGILSAAAKVGIGISQKDAGVTLAHVPGSEEPQVVASHEQPDDSAAVPVVKQ